MAVKRRILLRNRELIDQVQYLGAKASNVRRAVNQMLLRKSELEDLARDPHYAEDRFLEALKEYLRRTSDSITYISDHLESVIQARTYLLGMVKERERILTRCPEKVRLADGEGNEWWAHCNKQDDGGEHTCVFTNALGVLAHFSDGPDGTNPSLDEDSLLEDEDD